MLFDTHIHTTFSFDSRMTLEEAQSRAQARGMGLCITDHMDLNTKGQFFDPWTYQETYWPKRAKDLLIGTECGMDPRYSVKSEEYLKITSLDFTLGSVHTIGDEDIYSRSIYEKYEREEFWHAYFKVVLECLKTHPFIDSLSHLDYPARLLPYGEAGFNFRRHEKGILPIYEWLISHDLALELNLKRFAPETRAEFKTHFSVYRELGGKYVTLGSDSHNVAAVGFGLREGYDLLEELNLTPVHFEHHEIVSDHLY